MKEILRNTLTQVLSKHAKAPDYRYRGCKLQADEEQEHTHIHTEEENVNLKVLI